MDDDDDDAFDFDDMIDRQDDVDVPFVDANDEVDTLGGIGKDDDDFNGFFPDDDLDRDEGSRENDRSAVNAIGADPSSMSAAKRRKTVEESTATENGSDRGERRAEKRTTIDLDAYVREMAAETSARGLGAMGRGSKTKLRSRARNEGFKANAVDVEGECVGVTLGDGRRVYAKMEPRDTPLVPEEEIYGRGGDPGVSLLSRPIEDMLDEYEDERNRTAREAALREDEDADIDMSAMGAASREPQTAGQRMAERLRGQLRGALWTQKHTPRNFTDLLSSEYVNREVVHWIKGWDKVVFGRDPPPATMKKFYSDRYAERNGLKKRGPLKSEDTHVQLDATKRPMEKILLISGPPGVGKTTLAHIAAKHCGYEVVEINASDDRSASKLKVKLADALHSCSAFVQQKPKCVIIDEIDGVHNAGGDRGAIYAVLNALKSQKGGAPLSRPIIAICNDLYCTSLRPLRDVAKVIRVKPPPNATLNGRIREICAKENVDVEPRAVALVAERVNNDIRSALHTIQLIAKTSSKVTLREVAHAGAGEKDNKPQALTVWQDCLRGRHTFPKSRLESETGSNPHMAKMREKIEVFQDNDAVFDGMFENIPKVRFQDGTMRRMTQAMNAVLDGVMFQTKSFTAGDHTLRQYAETCALTVHSCASHADALGDDFVWPKSGRAAKERNTRMATLSARRSALDGKIARCSLVSDVTETLPYLNSILAPELRSVGTTFMTSDEKATLDRLVGLMRAHGLSYKPAKTVDGDKSWRVSANTLVLDPPVDEFVKFGAGVDAMKTLDRLSWREQRERDEAPPTAPQHLDLVPRRAVNNSLRSIIATAIAISADRSSPAEASAEAARLKSERKARVALGVAGGNLNRARKIRAGDDDVGTVYKYNEGHTTGVRRAVLMRHLFPELKSASV